MTTSEPSPPNIAAWLLAKGATLTVDVAPYAAPRDKEIVVRNRAVAINPIDWIIQATGGFVFPWLTYPFVLGADLAGDVVDVGASVTRFKVGDRVLGHAVGSDAKRNAAAEGAFQDYTVLLEHMAAPIPDDLSYERATVIPLALSTAACGLFQTDYLALTHPSSAPEPAGKTLLVWGGSTSVGSNAIQLAVAAGYDVVTTASPKNFAYVKNLGATAAFDYRNANVVGEIIGALEGKTIAGALAIGAGSAAACIDVVRAGDGNKFVAMTTFPISFANVAGSPGAFQQLATMWKFVWFSATTWVRCRRHGIRTKFIAGSSLIGNDIGPMIYADFLPAALAERQFIAAPEPAIVGHGLGSVQHGLDTQRKGVSASKVVVSLSPVEDVR